MMVVVCVCKLHIKFFSAKIGINTEVQNISQEIRILREIFVDMIRVAVFASGTGTNCENLIRYFNGGSLAEIVVVLSNRSQAPVLERSRALGVEALYLPKAGFENGEVLDILKERNI